MFFSQLICLAFLSYSLGVGAIEVNIAEGKPTSQITTHAWGISSNAVDGNINPEWWAKSCSHTDQQTGHSWWCVNLQSIEPFRTIKLYNRNKLKERLNGFSIKLSNIGGCDQSTFEASKVCYTDTTTNAQDIYTVNKCKKGQFIFVSIPQNGLTICEAQILQEVVNIAEGKETSQSSTYDVGKSSLATDGNTNREYKYCSHTAKQTGPSWWCVNLQSVERFQIIKLYNRDSVKERLKGFSIKVSNTGGCDQSTFDASKLCYTDTTSTPQDVYTVDKCKVGQYIFVTVPHLYLTLCEVEILQAIENIAEGKETSQSSTYASRNSLLAIDGNTNPDMDSMSCSHTAKQTGPSWWCVNLQSIERFQTIKLYNRDSVKERLKGFSIKVSNTGGCDQSTFESSKVCYTDTTSVPQDSYTVDKCKVGQYVFVTVPHLYLTLCEVEILQGRNCRPSCQIQIKTDGLFAIFPVNNEAECNAKCSATTGCTLGIFFYGECELFFNLAHKPTNSVDACTRLCIGTSGCNGLRHVGTNCVLYKKRFDKTVANPQVSVLVCKDVEPPCK